jgi:hypothetical protein
MKEVFPRQKRRMNRNEQAKTLDHEGGHGVR